MVKVFVADDHPMVREGLKKIINSSGDLKLVGETADPNKVIDFCKETKTEVLLLDLSMPGKSGLDLIKEIRIQIPALKILIISMMPEEPFAKRSIRAGAYGYLPKESPPEEILLAIRKVANNRKYISSSLAEKIADNIDGTNKTPTELLSDRELQILKLIAEGTSLTSIANELSISTSTVNTYRKRLLTKLQLKTNAELIYFAINNKLVEPR